MSEKRGVFMPAADPGEGVHRGGRPGANAGIAVLHRQGGRLDRVQGWAASSASLTPAANPYPVQ
jgi:hypothetical protein